MPADMLATATSAERTLLGTILLDNTKLYDVQTKLQPEHFSNTAHRRIFAAVAALSEIGRPFELAELANHLGIELLNTLGSVKFLHVPYKGGAPAVIDLVAGRVQILFSGIPQVSSMVKAGRLRIIAVATQKSTRVAPEFPPIADIFPGFDCNTWYGLRAPTGGGGSGLGGFAFGGGPQPKFWSQGEKWVIAIRHSDLPTP